MAQNNPPHSRRTELTFEQLARQGPFRIELMNPRPPADADDEIIAITQPMKSEAGETLLTELIGEWQARKR